MPDQKNVLIYRVGQLGDTLVALPALQAIAHKHQGCRLVLLTDRHATARGYVSSWDVIGPTGWIDEVLFYEPRDQSTLERLRQTLNLLKRLRSFQFEQVYNLALRNSEQSVSRDRFFFGRLAGSKQYYGMAALRYPLPPRTYWKNASYDARMKNRRNEMPSILCGLS